MNKLAKYYELEFFYFRSSHSTNLGISHKWQASRGLCAKAKSSSSLLISLITTIDDLSSTQPQKQIPRRKMNATSKKKRKMDKKATNEIPTENDE